MFTEVSVLMFTGMGGGSAAGKSCLRDERLVPVGGKG